MVSFGYFKQLLFVHDELDPHHDEMLVYIQKCKNRKRDQAPSSATEYNCRREPTREENADSLSPYK